MALSVVLCLIITLLLLLCLVLVCRGLVGFDVGFEFGVYSE